MKMNKRTFLWYSLVLLAASIGAVLLAAFAAGTNVDSIEKDQEIAELNLQLFAANEEIEQLRTSAADTSELDSANAQIAQLNQEVQELNTALQQRIQQQESRVQSIEAIKTARTQVGEGKFSDALKVLATVDTNIISSIDRTEFLRVQRLAENKKKK